MYPAPRRAVQTEKVAGSPVRSLTYQTPGRSALPRGWLGRSARKRRTDGHSEGETPTDDQIRKGRTSGGMTEGKKVRTPMFPGQHEPGCLRKAVRSPGVKSAVMFARSGAGP